MNSIIKKKIDIKNLSEKNIDSPPGPKPLTPKTYDYCIKNLCYAPIIKKKNYLDKTDRYMKLKL